MPYTLSHPAATLPIWRMTNKRLRLAALVVGAASPDFPYVWPGLNSGHFSHTFLGLVFFCLPLSWFVLWLFDRWGRKGVEAVLPSSWVLPTAPNPPRPFACTSAAIVLGALSHVIWDSFTHRSGWFVRTLPLLATPLSADFPSLTVFRVLQHGSTIVGLLILAWPCWRWMRSQPPVPWADLGKRALICGMFVGFVGILNGMRYAHKGFPQFLAGGGVGVTVALMMGVLLLGCRPQTARMFESIVSRSPRGQRRFETSE